MRIGLIDLGTNSVRFDIYEVLPNQQTRRLLRKKTMIRLGENVFSTGLITASAQERMLKALLLFKNECRFFGVDQIRAFGTSALRTARNSKQIIAEVRSQCDIDIEIMSGQVEAELIALGILENSTKLPQEFILLDIGGGSMEISFCRKGKVLTSKSFDLGTARMQQVFLKKHPPEAHSVLAMRSLVHQKLKTFEMPKNFKPRFIIGSSGGIKNIVQVHESLLGVETVSIENLSHLNQKFSWFSQNQLRQVPGMEARRTDLYLSGALLLEAVIQNYDCRAVRYSPFSLREGLFHKYVLSAQNKEGPKLLSQTLVFAERFLKPYKIQKILELKKILHRKKFKLSAANLEIIFSALLLSLVGYKVSPLKKFEMASELVGMTDFYWKQKSKKAMLRSFLSSLDKKNLNSLILSQKKVWIWTWVLSHYFEKEISSQKDENFAIRAGRLHILLERTLFLDMHKNQWEKTIPIKINF